MAFRLTIPKEIRSILNDYPCSASGTVGEALQNAADSGATTLRVELHGPKCLQSTLLSTTPSPDHEELETPDGPAGAGSQVLTICNNALFSDEDARSWRNLKDSVKNDCPADVGSKGCGAKSYFHFADVVVVKSGGIWLLSDPCDKLTNKGGALGGLEVREGSPQTEKEQFLAAVSELGNAARKIFDAGDERETLFLLPLRTKKSELSDNCFGKVAEVAEFEEDLRRYPMELMHDAVNLSRAIEKVVVGRCGEWQRVLVTRWGELPGGEGGGDQQEVVVQEGEEAQELGQEGMLGENGDGPLAKRRRTQSDAGEGVLHNPPNFTSGGGATSSSAAVAAAPGARGSAGGTGTPAGRRIGSYPAIFSALKNFKTYDRLYRELGHRSPSLSPLAGPPGRGPDGPSPRPPAAAGSARRPRAQSAAPPAAREWIGVPAPPEGGTLVRFELSEHSPPTRTIIAEAAYRVFCDFWLTNPALLELGREVQQVPVAGVAFPVSDEKSSRNYSGEAGSTAAAAPPRVVQHPCYCFLPLRGELLPGLPCLLNAAFAVTEDRQRLVAVVDEGAVDRSSSRRFGEQRNKGLWNKGLLEGPLPEAYVQVGGTLLLEGG